MGEKNIRTLSGQKALTTDEIVTLSKFDGLQTGMTYKQVVSILKREGVLVSQNEFFGVRTEMYEWPNGVSSMNAMFQGGKLTSKAQFGLE